MIGLPSLYNCETVIIHGIEIPLTNFRYEYTKQNGLYPKCHVELEFDLSQALQQRLDTMLTEQYRPVPPDRNIALSL